MPSSIDVILGLDVSGLTKGVDKAKKSITGFGKNVGKSLGDAEGKFQKLGSAIEANSTRILQFSATVVALGTAAVAAAADYEREFSKITGLVGLSTAEVDKLAAATLDLAGATGRGPQELAQAMFTIQSAGIQGAAGMEALEIAAKSAAAGMGTTQDNARALTGALNAYKDSGLTAARAGDVLAATARAGNFEVSGLASALGRVLPVASQLGVPLEEVGGAIALLTRNGLTASEAITQVRSVLNKMLNPTKDAKDALDAVGLSMTDVKETLQNDGMVAALEQMYDAVGRSDEEFAKLIGGEEAISAAFSLMGASAEDLEATFGQVGDSTGVLQEAFDAAADTAGFKMQQALTEIKVSLIALGDTLLPFAAKLADVVGTIAGAFADLPGPIQTAAGSLLGLTAAAGPVALTLIKVVKPLKLMTTEAAAAAGGFRALGASLAASAGPFLVLAAAITVAITAWDNHRDAQQRAAEAQDLWINNLAGGSSPMADQIARMKELSAAVDGVTDSTETLTKTMNGLTLQDAVGPEAAAIFDELGISMDTVVRDAEKLGPAFQTANDAVTPIGALGDAIRTMSFGLSDSLRSNEHWARNIRESLTPAATEAGTVLGGLVDALERGDIDIATFRNITEDLGYLLPAIKETKDAVVRTGEEFNNFLDDVGGVTDAMRLQAVVQAAINEGWFDLADALIAGDQGMIDAAKASIILSGEIQEVGREAQNASLEATLYGDAWELVEEKLRQGAEAAAKAKFDMLDLTDSQIQGILAMSKLEDGTISWQKAMRVAAGFTVELGDDLRNLTEEELAAEKAAQDLAAGIRTSFRDALDAPQDLIDKITDVRLAAAEEIVLGEFSNAEILEIQLEELEEALSHISDEEWEIAVTGDMDDFDDEIARALLTAQGFEAETIEAIITGDAAQYQETVVAAIIAGNHLTEEAFIAIFGADASALFQTLKVALEGVALLDQALASVKLAMNNVLDSGFVDGHVYAALQNKAHGLRTEIGAANIDINAMTGELLALEQQSGKTDTSIGGTTRSAKSAGDAAKDAADDTGELTEAEKELAKEAEEAEEALADLREAAVDLLDATFDLIAPTLDLADAYGQVESAASDAKSALDSFNGLQKDLIESTDDYWESMENLNEQFGIGEDANEDFVATLESSSKQGRENRDAFIDMFDAIQDVAIATAVATGSQEEANAAFDAGVSELVRIARQAGFTETEIQGLVTLYGQFPDQVVTELLVNSKAAREGMAEAQALLLEFEGRPYQAYLAANSDAVRREVGEALVATAGLTEEEFVAELAANSNPFDQAVSTALLLAAGFDDAEAIASLDADDQGYRTKMLAALVDLDLIDKREARAVISATFGPGSVNMKDLNIELDKIEDADPVITIDQDGNAIPKIDIILQKVTDLTGKEIAVLLEADASPFDETTNSAILRLAGFADYEALAALGADDIQLRTALLAALVDLGVISNYEARAIISANYGPDSIKPSEFKDGLDQIGNTNVSATVNLAGDASEKVPKISDDVTDLDGKEATPVVEVKGQGEFAMKRSLEHMEGIQDIGDLNVNIITNAPAAEAEVESLGSTMDSESSKKRVATIDVEENNLQPTSAAITSEAEKARLATIDVTESNLGATGSAIDAVANKSRTATINVVASGIGGVQGAINGIQGKSVSVDVVTHYSSTGSSAEAAADGGIFRGGVKSFAHGGFNEPHIAKGRRGGIIRYAELSTDREAFIPYASAKRPRAQRLAKKVVSDFGGHVVGFEDGGFNDHALVRQPDVTTSFRGSGGTFGGGGGTVVIEAPVTINGTPSEDVSRMVERGLDELVRTVKMEAGRR